MMNKKYYIDFMKFWVPVLRKQYRNGTYSDKRAIKNNVFHNMNFNEKQKEEIWDRIIK